MFDEVTFDQIFFNGQGTEIVIKQISDIGSGIDSGIINRGFEKIIINKNIDEILVQENGNAIDNVSYSEKIFKEVLDSGSGAEEISIIIWDIYSLKYTKRGSEYLDKFLDKGNIYNNKHSKRNNIYQNKL